MRENSLSKEIVAIGIEGAVHFCKVLARLLCFFRILQSYCTRFFGTGSPASADTGRLKQMLGSTPGEEKKYELDQ